MSYTYSETLAANGAYGRSELIIQARGTSSVVSVPKTLALAAICEINSYSTTDYTSLKYQELAADSETGFAITGKCDINLVAKYNGSTATAAKVFTLELKDVNIFSAGSFKTAVTNMLNTYYPSIAVTDLFITTIIFNFKE